MAQRRRPTPDDIPQRPPPRARPDVKGPPAVAAHALSFPWATSLAIGWGAPDRAPDAAPPPAPSPRRGKPVPE